MNVVLDEALESYDEGIIQIRDSDTTDQLMETVALVHDFMTSSAESH